MLVHIWKGNKAIKYFLKNYFSCYLYIESALYSRENTTSKLFCPPNITVMRLGTPGQSPRLFSPIVYNCFQAW